MLALLLWGLAWGFVTGIQASFNTNPRWENAL